MFTPIVWAWVVAEAAWFRWTKSCCSPQPETLPVPPQPLGWDCDEWVDFLFKAVDLINGWMQSPTVKLSTQGIVVDGAKAGRLFKQGKSYKLILNESGDREYYDAIHPTRDDAIADLLHILWD